MNPLQGSGGALIAVIAASAALLLLAPGSGSGGGPPASDPVPTPTPAPFGRADPTVQLGSAVAGSDPSFANEGFVYPGTYIPGSTRHWRSRIDREVKRTPTARRTGSSVTRQALMAANLPGAGSISNSACPGSKWW